MSRREIDLNRCLFHYPHITCNRCQTICPQQAIKMRDIDREKCDNCGLCTAVCPTGAIQSDNDYDTALTATQNLTPQVLMCRKVSPAAMSCLGALNRRLLWALASSRELAIDTSRCAKCNPSVADWLNGEITACNEALQAAGKAPIKLVHVKEATPAPTAVARRSFFRSLFHAASDTARQIAKAQTEQQYTFDPVIWLNKQAPAPCALFPGLELQPSCTACGLCATLCPEKALSIHTDETGPKLHFNPIKCTACGLCASNCPQECLNVRPHFNGSTEFALQNSPATTPPANNTFTLQRG